MKELPTTKKAPFFTLSIFYLASILSSVKGAFLSASVQDNCGPIAAGPQKPRYIYNLDWKEARERPSFKGLGYIC
jgi:hypothetical protein